MIIFAYVPPLALVRDEFSEYSRAPILSITQFFIKKAPDSGKYPHVRQFVNPYLTIPLKIGSVTQYRIQRIMQVCKHRYFSKCDF